MQNNLMKLAEVRDIQRTIAEASSMIVHDDYLQAGDVGVLAKLIGYASAHAMKKLCEIMADQQSEKS
jgi:hypothetical protein